MKVITIEEPKNKKITAEADFLSVGIDFGTTNSLVACVFEDNQIATIGNKQNNGLLASTISWNGQDLIIGSKDNILALRSIKRIIGKSYEEVKNSNFLPFYWKNQMIDLNGHVAFEFGDKIFSTLELASRIFLKLKTEAEKDLNSTINSCVLTVPAHLDEVGRNIIKTAAEMIGFKVLRILSEPTAAAYAYGLENKSQGTYLVYDLGGGTFDLSLLKMHMGAFQVLATSGDSQLGGDDIDKDIVDYIALKLDLEKDYVDRNYALIYSQAKFAKEILSNQEKVTISFLSNILVLTKNEVEDISIKFINKTLIILKNLLDEYIGIDRLNGIILVGGATRMPLIKNTLQEHMHNIEIFSNLDPDKVVAYGAALQAYNLSHKTGDILIDVTPLSLGIEMLNGLVERVIERNTPTPATVTKYFTTHMDNQNGMSFHILQGERELAKDCRSLAKFELKNLPMAKAGALKIALCLNIDVDGLLSITAQEKTTKVSCQIEIKPSYGLNEELVDEFLISAIEHSGQDFEIKKLIEIKEKSEKLIHYINQILPELNEIISQELIKNLSDLENKLLQNLNNPNFKDFKIIKEDYDNLDQMFAPIAEEFLNYKTVKLLVGKDI